MENKKPIRLDDLYRMTSYIYDDKNSSRTKEATFLHFVEVCGMLTLHDRKKKREKFGMGDALCKALGWYFPLLAKMRIKSVEALVFRKFPGVCPYCRRAPHDEMICKVVKGTDQTVNHAEVINIFRQKWDSRPDTLDAWQSMFAQIYPRNITESGRSTIGLMEELGELSESIRVFDSHPHYFIGEAADIFSYIMGFANEYAVREVQDSREFSFQREFLSQYPGLCSQCGSRVCCCPSIPAATIGRMAKEIKIDDEENLFIQNRQEFFEQGRLSASVALESLGGYAGLASSLPFDRGDINHALVQLCLKMASIVQESNPSLAETLQAEVVKLVNGIKEAGTPRATMEVTDLLSKLRDLWNILDDQSRDDIRDSNPLISEIADVLEKIRILFVTCSPKKHELRLGSESRAIREAIRTTPHGNRLIIDELPAATRDDFRRALLRTSFDIVHFSGHANAEVLLFEDSSGNPVEVPISAVSEALSRHPSIKCVVLNACDSLVSFPPIAKGHTIGMASEIEDDASIEFSRGFYDALAMGKTVEDSFVEGKLAVMLGGFSSDPIRIIPAP